MTYPALPRACPNCVPTPQPPRPPDVLCWCQVCGFKHLNDDRLCDISEAELTAVAGQYVPSPAPVVTA